MAVALRSTYPNNGAGLSITDSATAWTFSAWNQIVASFPDDVYITGITYQIQTSPPAADTTYEQEIQIGTGSAGSETVIIKVPANYRADTITSANNGLGYWRTQSIDFSDTPQFVAANTRIAVRVTDSIAAATTFGGIKISYIQVVPNPLSILEYRMTDLNPTYSDTNITGGAITNASLTNVYSANDGWPTQPHLVTLPLNSNTTLTDAVANAQYFTISVTPNTGYKVSLSKITFLVGRGGASTPRGYAVRGSGDSYASNLSTADVATQNPTWTYISIDLSGISAYQDKTSALTFRFYTYTPSNAVSIDYDNILVFGTVATNGTAYTSTVSDTFTWSEAIIRAAAKVVSDTETTTETIRKSTTTTKSDTGTISDSITKQPQKVGSDAFTWSENFSFLKTIIKLITDTFSYSENFIKSTIRSISDAVTTTEVITKSTTKPLSGDLFSVTESVTKTPTKNVSSPLLFTEAITRVVSKVISQTFSWTENFSASKFIMKLLDDTFSVGDSITKSASKVIESGISWADSLSITKLFIRVLTDSISITESFVKSIQRFVDDTFIHTSTLSKVAQKQIEDRISYIDTIKRYLNGLLLKWSNLVNTVRSWGSQNKNSQLWDNKDIAATTFTSGAKRETDLTIKEKQSSSWDNKSRE